MFYFTKTFDSFLLKYVPFFDKALKIQIHLEDQFIEAKILKLTKQEAEIFYEVHKEKPFFNSLINYMTSNKIMALKIEGEDAVNKYRKLMGSTDPESADEGTIRKLYAESKERNSVHGSDSVENSDIEIKFFFE